MDKIEYTITAEQFLSDVGVKFTKRGNWLSCKYCVFCGGGRTRQVYTFGVRADDYNYNCLRTTCGKSGSFWTLLEHFGYDPKEYIKKSGQSNKLSETTKKSKGYVYRRKD